MIDELVRIHNEVTSQIPKGVKRYLYSQINWQSQGLCILGDRGVGKTTMICQDLLERYGTPDKALYISADNILVQSLGLFNIASEFFREGGIALYIDEVHKYPNWSVEVKNILDTYKGRQLIFSASSSLDLNQSKGDLSRRVIYHRLIGLSFREYLLMNHHLEIPVYTIEQILQNHVAIASNLKSVPIIQYFKQYVKCGYYPYFLEGVSDYYAKLTNVIEKVLFEDVATVFNLKQSTIPILKKILWLIATSDGLVPNVDKMSKNLGVSRELVYNCLEYLCRSGLTLELFPCGKGNNLIRKPAKIYLNNTNLLHVIHGALKIEIKDGGIRETFFVNQLQNGYRVCQYEKADYLVNDTWIMEVGGKNKNDYQIRDEKNGYLILDNLESGFGRKIPLWLFGLLY